MAVVTQVVGREGLVVLIGLAQVQTLRLPHVGPCIEVVAAVGPVVVVRSEPGTVAVPTLEVASAVRVPVAVSLSETTGSVPGAAALAETLDDRAPWTDLVGTGSDVAGGAAVLAPADHGLPGATLDPGGAPGSTVGRVMGGAVGESPALVLEGELAGLPAEPVALGGSAVVTSTRLVGPDPGA